MTDKDGLLPCPFCGQPPERFSGHGTLQAKCVTTTCPMNYIWPSAEIWNRRAPAGGWVSCSERLPTKDDLLPSTRDGELFHLLVVVHGRVMEGIASFFDGETLMWPLCRGGYDHRKAVTHWMPLPTPPGGEQNRKADVQVPESAMTGADPSARGASLESATTPAAAPPAGEPVHSDHPLRHFDRTCPACIAEGQEREAHWNGRAAEVAALPEEPKRTAEGLWRYQRSALEWFESLDPLTAFHAYAKDMRQSAARLQGEIAELRTDHDNLKQAYGAAIMRLQELGEKSVPLAARGRSSP